MVLVAWADFSFKRHLKTFLFNSCFTPPLIGAVSSSSVHASRVALEKCDQYYDRQEGYVFASVGLSVSRIIQTLVD